jgi:hypothetical protein
MDHLFRTTTIWMDGSLFPKTFYGLSFFQFHVSSGRWVVRNALVVGSK